MLTSPEKDNLIALGILNADWVITDYFGEDLRKYLVFKAGFPILLDTTPATEVIRNAMTVSGLIAANDEDDPVDTLIANVAAAYASDSFDSGNGINAYRPNPFIGGSQFLATDGGSLYLFLGETTKVIAVTDGTINAIVQEGSTVYIAGLFDDVDGTAGFNNVAKLTIDLDGVTATTAEAMGDGFDGEVFCLEIIGGEVYAGGAFANSGIVPMSKAAKFVTTDWEALSADILDDQVNVIKERPSSGEIYIGIGDPVLNNNLTGSKLFLLTTGLTPAWEPLQFNEVNETFLEYTFTTNVALTGVAPLIQDTNDLTGITTAKIKLTGQTNPAEDGYYTYTDTAGTYTLTAWGGWIYDGAVNDIIFNGDSSMMVVGGKFESHCTGLDFDLLVVNIDDNNLNNTTEHRGFNLATTGTVTKMFLADDGTTLFVSGSNISDLSYLSSIGLTETLHVPGGFAISNVFNPATFNYETISRFYDANASEVTNIKLLLSETFLYAHGDFNFAGGDYQEIYSWDADTKEEIKKSSNVRGTALCVVPNYSIGNWFPCFNDSEPVFFNKLCGLVIPPP